MGAWTALFDWFKTGSLSLGFVQFGQWMAIGLQNCFPGGEFSTCGPLNCSTRINYLLRKFYTLFPGVLGFWGFGVLG